MKKSTYLFNARRYYNLQVEENDTNGDTNKRREYIQNMIENVKKYRELGGRYIDLLELYKPIKELYDYYYNELIFKPTIEDLKEMQYWI